MHRRPPHQSRAKAHAPTMLPAAHQPGPKPPGPAVTPTQRQSAPRTQAPPRTTRNSTAARLATYVRRHRSPAAPHVSRQKNSTQESPIPHTGQGRSPSAEPPKKPTPREPPDAPGPYRHPHANTKTTAGQNRTPTHIR